MHGVKMLGRTLTNVLFHFTMSVHIHGYWSVTCWYTEVRSSTRTCHTATWPRKISARLSNRICKPLSLIASGSQFSFLDWWCSNHFFMQESPQISQWFLENRFQFAQFPRRKTDLKMTNFLINLRSMPPAFANSSSGLGNWSERRTFPHQFPDRNLMQSFDYLLGII